jgi:AAA15 family ATPase/GTPase
MELLFLWVADHNCIKNQEFNFSPIYKFNFKPDLNEIKSNRRITKGVLHKSEIIPEIDGNLFGDHIRNITAIVGQNGTGKSSLIKNIFSFSKKLGGTEC